jgi:hypothetical protein
MLKIKKSKKRAIKPVKIKVQKKPLSKKTTRKSIFQKSKFPKAPGGNLYEWKEAATVFDVPKDGLYSMNYRQLTQAVYLEGKLRLSGIFPALHFDVPAYDFFIDAHGGNKVAS